MQMTRTPMAGLAISLLLAVPAYAQDAPATGPSTDTATPESPDLPRVGTEELRAILESLDADPQGPFVGALVRARTEAGHHVSILAGSADFAMGEVGDETLVELGDFPDRLIEGGLRLVQPDTDRIVMQGMWEDHDVLVIGAAAAAALPGEEADSGGPDLEVIRGYLEDAGLELEEAPAVQAYQATADSGRPILIMLGRNGFSSETELDRAGFQERLQAAGVQDVTPVEDGLDIARGGVLHVGVLALAGPAVHRTITEAD